MWTTHGGRMSSPIIDGDQLIVSGLMFSWGQHAGGAHRFLSFDKTTGRMNWISSPEGRPTDTIYANPYVADVNGTRTFFSGGSDGAMHALKDQYRRKDLELARQPARLEHGGAHDRPGRDRLAQRGEHRHDRDGHARRDAGRQEGRR